MTFQGIEISVDNGRPVELLQINYSTNQWYYTSSQESIIYNGNTYIPLAYERSSLVADDDTAKSSLTIKLPQDVPVAELYRIQPPSEVVTVTVFGEHYLDNDFQTFWKGRIVNATQSPPLFEITCESLFSSLQRVGLRRRYSTQCSHVLYGPKCTVAREAFKTSGVVTALTGATVRVAAVIGQPTDYFAGGYINWVHNVRNNNEFRMIRASVSINGDLVLASQPTGLSIGQTVSIYAGCDHTLPTCINKFNNSLNFGGTPYIPQKNPFGGSSIY